MGVEPVHDEKVGSAAGGAPDDVVQLKIRKDDFVRNRRIHE